MTAYLFLALIYSVIWMFASGVYFHFKGYPFDKPWTYIAFGPFVTTVTILVLVLPAVLFGVI